MNKKNYIISSKQFNTIFQNSINNNLNIRKIWKKSGNTKLLYNNNKNPEILLKVRNINETDFFNLISELKAFSLINNKNPNIVNVVKSFICDQNNNYYELNKNKLIPFISPVPLCYKFINQNNIPISILALKYINGISLNNINLTMYNINTFKLILRDFFIQLYCVFFHLSKLNMEIIDTNLDNFLYVYKSDDLDYTFLFGSNGIIHVDFKFCVIDLDHVKQNITNNNNGLKLNTDIRINKYIFDTRHFFYKFFLKFINQNKYRDIENYILQLRNLLFETSYNNNFNIKKSSPLQIIELIRNFYV